MPLSSQAEGGGLTDACARAGDERNPHPLPGVIAKESGRAIAVPYMLILLGDTSGWQNLCLTPPAAHGSMIPEPCGQGTHTPN
jgi:hypothetical protein